LNFVDLANSLIVMSTFSRQLLAAQLLIIAGSGCGKSGHTGSPSIMVESKHSHYHVHAVDASHEHSHPDGAVGGHEHSHRHGAEVNSRRSETEQ
jgi:hypothetical protein